MKYKIALSTAAMFFASVGFFSTSTSVIAGQNEAEMTSCIRTIMKLDEGRWDYMGTIARIGGKFRTYEATSVHSSAGPDMWSSKAFGGDVGGTEESAKTNFVKLIGTSIVPIENGKLNEQGAIKYLSCVGPDPEGRYEAHLEYKIPVRDGTFDTAKNVSWYSEHGSYYAEDNYNEEGRVIARRSGVNTPAAE